VLSLAAKSHGQAKTFNCLILFSIPNRPCVQTKFKGVHFQRCKTWDWFLLTLSQQIKKVIGGQIFDHDRHDRAVPGSPSKPANQRTGKSALQ
jgi:hypothetical protein